MKRFSLLLVAVSSLGAPHLGQDTPVVGDETRGLVTNLEGAYQGYTMVAPLSTTRVLIFDMAGQIVHEWECGLPAAGGVYLRDNGNLIYPARPEENPRFSGGGIGGVIKEFTWDGELVWSYELGDDYQTMHHDVEPLPNGNLLAIAWEHRYREDAIEAGRDPAAIGEAGMWPDCVLELKPIYPDDAEIVWEWHAWDHLIQDFDPSKQGHGSISEHPERIDINADHRDQAPLTEEELRAQEELEEQMRALGYVGGDEDEEDEDAAPNLGSAPDWLHTNGIDYHPELDLILLSSPEMNEVWVIDHSLSRDDTVYNSGGRFGKGGSLLYRIGNPKNYGLGDESARRFFYQHDAQWILDGSDELKFSLFNNGRGRPDGDYSSIDVYTLSFDAKTGFARKAGKPFGPEEPLWSYSAKGKFFSSFISGVQWLPNGNMLVCSGAPGRIFEVTPAKEIVWEFLNPVTGNANPGTGGAAPPTALFRATRFGLDHPAVKGRF